MESIRKAKATIAETSSLVLSRPKDVVGALLARGGPHSGRPISASSLRIGLNFQSSKVPLLVDLHSSSKRGFLLKVIVGSEGLSRNDEVMVLLILEDIET